ncbi:relaxin receptor 1-like [Centruroides sculpturatus]|uniref:relaxin receptor 1-like n=1 Tax=Centruroides sculpturatus TaxID=218467 RepID=UPI000C6E516A|nr:relaxin receptor 1-like [Centruroides sculpturatus]
MKLHKQKRLNFVKRYKDWTLEDWSDESKINRVGSERRWIWTTSMKSITEREIQIILKFGSGSLMVWALLPILGLLYLMKWIEYLIGNKLSSIADFTFLRNNYIKLLVISFNKIQYLDNGSFIGLRNLRELDLRNCELKSLNSETFKPLKMLESLLLDGNQLEEFEQGIFKYLSKLKLLSLRRNRIKYIKEEIFYGLHSLKALSLSWNELSQLDEDSFGNISSLINLDLENNNLISIKRNTFSQLINLQTLNLKKNKLKDLHSDTFIPLTSLTHIYFQDFRMCSYALHIRVCEPRGDGISSVTHLLDSLILRISVWIVAFLACLGNLLVLVGRHLVKETNEVHSIYIKNLAVADFLMGIYLFMIAGHDMAFRGDYVNHDKHWRHSWKCNFCGILSTLSSEASVFMLTVITIDRYLSILYPLSLKRRTVKFSFICSSIIWIVASIISILPIFDLGYFGNEFYGNNGVCLPLHIHDPFAAAWEYSLFVFCGINTLAFLFILFSYVRMFAAIQRSSMGVRSSQQQYERTIAKRFAFIVGTDMICWVPVIFIKFLAVGGIQINEELYAWVAVFLLPINSALNPVLYTLTTKLFKQHIAKFVINWRPSPSLSVATDTSAISLSSILNVKAHKVSIKRTPHEVDSSVRQSSLLSSNSRIPVRNSWYSPQRVHYQRNNYF